MYIKVKDRELFKKLDENLSIPPRWEEFIEERVAKNNLIIKSKNKYRCLYCDNVFDDNVKINEYCKCPNCNNLYKVKSDRLSYYEFKDDLAIFDKYDDYYIVRVFRLHTIYSHKHMKTNCYEYGRIIYDKSLKVIEEIVNDNIIGTIGGYFVSLREQYSHNWKYFRSGYFYFPDQFIYYPYNLEEMLSYNKKLKYSQIWELAKHVDYFNLIYLIKNYNPSVELLTKMKLYNLALCPKSFANKRTFEERFMGLSKDYLPFIQEYNLDIDELITLSFIKEKNINFLKRCKGMGQDNLEQLQEKVNIKTLLNKTNFSSDNYYEYRDYLDLVKKLKLNMKDKVRNIKKIVEINGINTSDLKVLSKEEMDELFKKFKEGDTQAKEKIATGNLRLVLSIIKKYKSLKCNIFEDKKYIIFPAENMDALIDESSQQNNCVRTYADRIASGKCDIYFMRLVSDQNKSLVTIEVKNKKVVQKRTKHNGNTTLEQDKFITNWERKILNKESMCNDRN